MTQFSTHINQQIDHLFRHESGKMVAVLSRLLGIQHLDAAQDIVQDTLLQAMNTWSYHGLPDNPAAWLMKAAKNKAIDHIRREKRFAAISPKYAYLLQSELAVTPAITQLFLEDEIADSQLRMIFACCHPAIPVESQMALTLKTLCGLSVQEIAHAFLTTEETVAKRIYRAKEKIKSACIELEVPQGIALLERINIVLRVLYLLFNEGYNSSHTEKLIREDLCMEAIRLCYLLINHTITTLPRVKALLALMCFQASRLNARLDDKNNIILLKYQDRALWYQPLMQQGFYYLDAAAEPFEESPYHLEAAIASLHAAAPSFAQTDWKKIYYLYGLLYTMQPSPIVAMNKAIAAGYANNKKQALLELQQIKLLENNHLYYACLGEVLLEMGDTEKAKSHFEKAYSLTESPQEKQLLHQKIKSC
jgi:RNA polymerase sigma factor (sigma-70 family)